MRNPYDILGLRVTASLADIRHAYRRLAMRWHPDRNASHEAETRFKQIKAAYELLTDPQALAAWQASQQQSATAGPASAAADDGPPPDGAAADAADPVPPARVETITLTLEEAAAGCRRSIVLATPVTCAPCSGSGRVTLAHSRACTACKGCGRVRVAQGTAPCTACAGKGFVREVSCEACHGHGRQQGTRAFEVVIPPGMLAGERLRLAGQGDAVELADGRVLRGDLLLEILWAPHPLFTVSGRDLRCQVPVSIFQLLLGGELAIPLLTGVGRLPLRPYPAHGLNYRLSGAGLPGRDGQPPGDLLIDCVADFPRHLSAEEQSLLARLLVLADAHVAEQSPVLAAWQATLRERAATATGH